MKKKWKKYLKKQNILIIIIKKIKIKYTIKVANKLNL